MDSTNSTTVVPVDSSEPTSTLIPEGEPSLCHPDRSSGASPLRSGGTTAANATQAPVDGTSTPKKSDPSKKSSLPATPPAPKPLPPDFHDHFFPIDLTLPPGSQDLSKNIPHPDAAECARRNARRGLDFNRRRSGLFTLWRR